MYNSYVKRCRGFSSRARTGISDLVQGSRRRWRRATKRLTVCNALVHQRQVRDPPPLLTNHMRDMLSPTVGQCCGQWAGALGEESPSPFSVS
eukprot:gene10164-7118_t